MVVRSMFVLVLYYTIVTSTAKSCYVAENHVVEWEFTKENTFKLTANIYKARSGYAAVGFKNSNTTMNGAYMFVAFDDNNTGNVSHYLIYNETKFLNLGKTNFSGEIVIDDKYDYLSPTYLSFQVIIPQPNGFFEFKDQPQYLVIALNEFSKPRSPDDFDQPTYQIIREINIFSEYKCKIYSHGRVADFHYSIIIVEALIYLILFGICLCLQNKQPLKSRAFTPYLALLAQFILVLNRIYLIFDLIWDLETSNKYCCHFVTFISSPVVVLSITLLPLNAYRYIFIVNINKQKEVIKVNKKGQIEEIKFYIRIFKLMVKPWFSFVVLGVTLMIWMIIALIITTAYNFECPRYTDIINEYMYIASISTIVVMGVAVLLYDICMNIKKVIRCKLRYLFFQEDAFYFRLETYKYLGLFLYYLITDLALGQYLYRWMKITLRSIAWYGLVGLQSVFPLVLTVIQIIKQPKDKKPRDDQDLDVLLSDKTIHSKFTEYCKSEWSYENIKLWDELQEFKRTDPSKQKEKAMQIYDTFLKPTAQLQVNLDKVTVDQVKAQLNEGNMNDIFKRVLMVLSQNLIDTFTRFMVTSEYKEIVRICEMTEKLKKDSFFI